MSQLAMDHWKRARDALLSANALMEVSLDGVASRAYYAVFHAVSALFALEGCEFAKHTAIRAAVHRELVKSGRWPAALGEAYSYLLRLREAGDYGGVQHVTREEAQEATDAARQILQAVSQAHPELGEDEPEER